jgi:glycosyltransferase involved in cell wall biosynthesis
MARNGVTIVIPNWNHELLLPRSISSGLAAVRCLGEEGVPGEVLVIDDCSRDGSLTLLRNLEAIYYDEGFRVLARSTNGGLAAARNLGLVHASHRYIIFMDADNELVPENMSAFYQTLEATGAAVAYGNLLMSSPQDTWASGILSNESFQSRIFDLNYIDAFSMVDRVQLLDGGGYLPYLEAHEDYEQWLHLACTGRRIVFVPMVFGYYFTMPNSMIKETSHDLIHRRARRVFNQFGGREHVPLATKHLRYHPAIGPL